MVLIVDVSGSMAPYARMLLQYVQAAVAARRRVEAFAFGTRLTRITQELQSRDPDPALARATAADIDYGGGTRIGEALAELNREHGRRVGRGAVTVLLSDGWDRGDPAQLAEEMVRLRRTSHRLVWLNPLAADPRYEPLTRGMQAALPHTDHLLPGNSIASLRALAELMESRREQFVDSLCDSGETTAMAEREVSSAIDRVVWYAGFCDKIEQLLSTKNPVATPHFNVSSPEATGVVAIVSPRSPSLLPLISTCIPAMCSGNAIVVGSFVPWSGIHNEGGVAGHNARIPARTFAELVGQDAVVKTLTTALETGRLAHAYLFSGPRGSGKTSAAKILARCIECAAGRLHVLHAGGVGVLGAAERARRRGQFAGRAAARLRAGRLRDAAADVHRHLARARHQHAAGADRAR